MRVERGIVQTVAALAHAAERRRFQVCGVEAYDAAREEAARRTVHEFPVLPSLESNFRGVELGGSCPVAGEQRAQLARGPAITDMAAVSPPR
jgi:hypothetical protein